jgi:hypothetical protein
VPVRGNNPSLDRHILVGRLVGAMKEEEATAPNLLHPLAWLDILKPFDDLATIVCVLSLMVLFGLPRVPKKIWAAISRPPDRSFPSAG